MSPRVLRRLTLNTLPQLARLIARLAAVVTVVTVAAGPAVASAAPASASGGAILARAAGTPVIGGALLAGNGVIVNYPAGGARNLPDIQASAWVIADAGTGQVLAAKDPHGLYLPASTLKVLTAVALIPVLNPNATVIASQLAASQTPNDIGLLAGQPYKVSDLFTALLTISANDAAVALTQATGSYARGMAIINAEAHHLQADDTVAVDPNGLDAPGQHTSAYDLALIARQALTMPAFMHYDTVEGGLFPIKPHKSVGLWNQNSLLTDYPGGIGGKIGWTSAAGATYVGMARRGNVTLIVSLLHCPALTEITSAETLLDWGFAEDGKVQPVGTLVPPLPVVSPASAASKRAAAAARASLEARDDAAATHAGMSTPALTAIALGLVAVLVASFAFTRSRRYPVR
jgi:serine-type D-Ala-D-Ala carboxypeptidase (penicillin-binding protein 5/6)